MNELQGRIRDMEHEEARFRKQLRSLEADREEIGSRLDEAGSRRAAVQEDSEKCQRERYGLEKEKEERNRDILR